MIVGVHVRALNRGLRRHVGEKKRDEDDRCNL